MKFRVVPRDERFYDLFDQAAGATVEAAVLLRDLLANGGDRVQAHEEIRRLEHVGDEVTREIVRHLNTSFVTPFDREDIHQLSSTLDDILDAIEAVADLMVLHNIDKALVEMEEQADVLVRASEQTREAVLRLRGFRDLEGVWQEIHRLEDEGDQVYRRTVARLFSGDFDAMAVLRWKDLVDQLEAAVDSCEQVATVVESIALKHA